MACRQSVLGGCSLGILALVLLLSLACASCSRQQKTAADGLPALEDLNVLLIVIDTLGAKHLGCYTPGLGNSPNIDYLARRGVMFQKASTPAPWTQPAVASLYTSLTPSDHGVLYMLDELADSRTTLAELMRERGFRTAGVISHFIIGAKYGFAQGFEVLDESPVGDYAAITSGRVTSSAIALLNSLAKERFFLLVHYFDPHFFYNHHPDFDLTSWYDGRLYPHMARQELRSIRHELAPEDIRYLEGLYREEVAFTDAQIGRLMSHLRRLGLTDKTLVILTADHGEAFMEHGWIGHTRNLYDELLHVPLIVSLPGVLAPRVSEAPVSLLDVVPTLMALSRRRAEGAAWQGQSLRSALTGRAEPAKDRELVAEVSFIQPSDWESVNADEKAAFLTCLRSGPLKVIHDLETGLWEYYDLLRDPDERDNLLPEGHDRAEPMQAKLRAWEDGRIESWGVRPDSSAVPDLETVRRLRSLGYLD